MYLIVRGCWVIIVPICIIWAKSISAALWILNQPTTKLAVVTN